MGLFFPPIILEELRARDGIDINMSRGSISGLSVEGVMTESVGGVGEVEILGLV